MSNEHVQESLFGEDGPPGAQEGVIWGFADHRFLPNFHPSPIEFEGVVFPTVEHAFQAAKTLDRSQRLAIAALPTPGKAKRAGRKLDLRGDWEAVKVDCMRHLLRLKFRPGSALAAKLVATHPARIFEANSWGDTFWGVDHRTGRGRNHLGILLEEIRSELMGS